MKSLVKHIILWQLEISKRNNMYDIYEQLFIDNLYLLDKFILNPYWIKERIYRQLIKQER